MKYLLFILTILAASTTLANYEGYDEIVDKLSKFSTSEVSTKKTYTAPMRTFSTAHIGLGFSQTFYDADAVNLNSRMQNQGGLAITIGIDMLSEKWAVEGSYINYGKTQPSSNTIKLREFTVRALYKPKVTNAWNARVGLGVSSRFLNISNSQINENYQTPSGLFVFGLESYINSSVSFGADLSFKTAMIDETVDKNSVDLAFKVDTHF